MNKLKKVINIIVDVLIVLVLIISAFVLISVFSTTKGGEGVPNLFGKAPVSVLTDSMKGDASDNFNKGDLLICDVVDEKANNQFKVGDIVTFRQDVDKDGKQDLVTHRIFKQNEDGSFQTKGDNNVTYDQNPAGTVVFGNIASSDILAIYHGSKIGGMGTALDFLRSPMGFFVCILLPMILFFIYQAVRVVMNIIAYNKEKAELAAREAIENSELTEEQKAKAIEEYLASQKAKMNEEASDGADDSPDKAES